jgi:hypothetical protein
MRSTSSPPPRGIFHNEYLTNDRSGDDDDDVEDDPGLLEREDSMEDAEATAALDLVRVVRRPPP